MSGGTNVPSVKMGLSSCFWPRSSCRWSLTVNAAYRASQMLLFVLIVVKAYSLLPHQDFCLVSQNMPTVSQTYRSWALATARIDSSFPNILDTEPTLCSHPGTWLGAELASWSRCWVRACMCGVLLLVCYPNLAIQRGTPRGAFYLQWQSCLTPFREG